jgi:hypothetical protein
MTDTPEMLGPQRLQVLKEFQIWLIKPHAIALHTYAESQGYEQPKTVIAASSLLVDAMASPHVGHYIREPYPEGKLGDRKGKLEAFRIRLSDPERQALRDIAEARGEAIRVCARHLVVDELTGLYREDDSLRDHATARAQQCLERSTAH